MRSESAGDPLGGDAEEGAGLDDQAGLEGGDESGDELEDFDLGGHRVDHAPALGLGTLGGGAMILRLHGPGGALVLEHDLVLLLDLLFEKAHVVYFILNGWAWAMRFGGRG